MPARTGGALRAAAAGAALLLLLGACSTARAQDGGGTSSTTVAGGSADPFGPDGPGPSDAPDPALAGQPVPTLPPGDPGTGEPPAGSGEADPDEDDDHADPDEHDDHAEDAEPGHGGAPDGELPAAAVLDAATVGALAGGTWSVAALPAGCTGDAPAGARASRSVALESAAGRLVSTVGAFADRRAGTGAVEATAQRLVGCGFAGVGDPRVGDASAELARSRPGGPERAVVLAAEGAVVVLVAAGSPAASGAWESLVDVALGSACAAAPHGCH